VVKDEDNKSIFQVYKVAANRTEGGGMTIQRYDVTSREQLKAYTGKYVLYTDHLTALAEKDTRIKELEEKLHLIETGGGGQGGCGFTGKIEVTYGGGGGGKVASGAGGSCSKHGVFTGVVCTKCVTAQKEAQDE
jgi:hypothetical protein